MILDVTTRFYTPAGKTPVKSGRYIQKPIRLTPVLKAYLSGQYQAAAYFFYSTHSSSLQQYLPGTLLGDEPLILAPRCLGSPRLSLLKSCNNKASRLLVL